MINDERFKEGKDLLYRAFSKTLRENEKDIFKYIYSGSGAIIVNYDDSYIFKACDVNDESKLRSLQKQCEWLRPKSGHGFACFSVVEEIIKDESGNNAFYYYAMYYDKSYKSLQDSLKANEISVDDTIDSIFQIINDFKKTCPKIGYDFDFGKYAKRLKDRINGVFINSQVISLFNEYGIMPLLVKYHDITTDYQADFEKERYFTDYHGDFTLENILVEEYNANVPRVIDPAHTVHYSSYLLDFGKLFQSLHFCYEEFFDEKIVMYKDSVSKNQKILNEIVENCYYKRKVFNELKNCYMTPEEYKLSLILEVSHYIRMLPFKIALGENQLIKNVVALKYSLLSCIRECSNEVGYAG